MKNWVVIFLMFSFVSLYAQERDSVKLFETPVQTRGIDTAALSVTKPVKKLRQLVAIEKKEIIPKIIIDKKLLDSLLKPYYVIKVDSMTLDTLFIPKYRMKINPITQDTSFLKKPTLKTYIVAEQVRGIDTLIFTRTESLKPKPVRIDPISRVTDPAWWANENSIGFDLNQAVFMNWSAGGENAISGLIKLHFNRIYENMHVLWKSEINARYGLNWQDGRELRKTDDEIRISSSLGYRRSEDSNWYSTMKFNFNTQFTDGYKYPDTENPISRFFAPAYLFFGAGSQYNLKKEHFVIYMSPITFKSTFVLDDILAEEGAFGVEKGKRSRIEFGALVQSSWDVEVFKNVVMLNKLSLYSDYLNNFGNIDVDWRLNFKFKVNNFFEANLGTQLFYDDDIKYKEVDENGDIITKGARLQFKENLNIGIIVKF